MILSMLAQDWQGLPSSRVGPFWGVSMGRFGICSWQVRSTTS